jgi:hypothetical protein
VTEPFGFKGLLFADSVLHRAPVEDPAARGLDGARSVRSEFQEHVEQQPGDLGAEIAAVRA